MQDNKHYFVLIKIQWSCFGYKNIERSDQFLMSRFSVILTHGIDMQIPFKTMLEWSICGGPNRHVDELRYKDPKLSPENLEEADCVKMQEIHAEQPTTQSRSQCKSSDDHILIL